jgi:hypothetical protein
VILTLRTMQQISFKDNPPLSEAINTRTSTIY